MTRSNKPLEKLGRQIKLVAGRAILALINDAAKAQSVQIEALPGEVLDGVERFQGVWYNVKSTSGSRGYFCRSGWAEAALCRRRHG